MPVVGVLVFEARPCVLAFIVRELRVPNDEPNFDRTLTRSSPDAKMALALVAHQDELEKMGCTLKSEVTLFWARLAERMADKAQENVGDIFSKCAETVRRDFLADTVEEMMELVGDTQIQQLLTNAGGKATWKNVIEYIVGSKFKSSAVQQLVPAPQLLTHNTVEPTFVISPIGAQMEAEGTLADEKLPAYVLNAHTECEDPKEQELTGPDVTMVLNAYTHHMIVTYGQPSGDRPLRMHHARSLKAAYPKLPKHGTTPGSARRWIKLLDERKRNYSRKSGLKARAGPPSSPPASRHARHHVIAAAAAATVNDSSALAAASLAAALTAATLATTLAAAPAAAALYRPMDCVLNVLAHRRGRSRASCSRRRKPSACSCRPC